MLLVLENLVKAPFKMDVPQQTVEKRKSTLDTVMVSSTGLTVLITKESGNGTKLTVKELSGMLKAMFTRVSSRTIWPTGQASILI
jgi:hypothetical protein